MKKRYVAAKDPFTTSWVVLDTEAQKVVYRGGKSKAESEAALRNRLNG